MTTGMGPPPPRNLSTSDEASPSSQTLTDQQPQPSPSILAKALMGPPPPPMNPNPPSISATDADLTTSSEAAIGAVSGDDAGNSSSDAGSEKQQQEEKLGKKPTNVDVVVGVPYTIPPWSQPPCHNYSLEVIKEGSIIDQINVYEKGAYMFGRVDLCDIVLEHPTISRFHAVLQFNEAGGAYLYDLSSTHGTFVNKNQVKKKVYVELHVGDVIRFGLSSRLYIFQGPADLMLPESDLKRIRDVKLRAERGDMEASLLRAKREASLADGISWGMDEDAVEEIEDDLEEITWQTYKGQLTEKQEKTREKVLKRLEKIANMKKEIDAIRAKDIAQGGLTQGQQTQIARNEQRISQVAEELENLEETLNESIRESLGARSGRISHGKKKGATGEDEDEYMSDEDEFYDRTRKKSSKQKKGAENQSVETADSLLDKKDSILKEIEEKQKMLLDEKDKVVPGNEDVGEAGDALDAYMSGLSSKLVHDKTDKLLKELQCLQSELQRILYLLKIADPTGEAAKRRESIACEVKQKNFKTPAPITIKKPSVDLNKRQGLEETISTKGQSLDSSTKPSAPEEDAKVITDETDGKAIVYAINKPQWLGAVEKKEEKQSQQVPLTLEDSEDFVEYNNRKEILGKVETVQKGLDSELENAAPGLIIRKRKQVIEGPNVAKVKDSEQSSAGVEIGAEDAVALLLKHTRGYDGEVGCDIEDLDVEKRAGKGKKRSKKALGPERPSFLNSEVDYESWVPPKGQSGDGRTSLNDRYGY